MKKVQILTSTFPRWKNDTTPSFILDLTLSYSSNFETLVLAPHYYGSKRNDRIFNVAIKRFRYFFPYKKQNIVYDGGGASKVTLRPAYLIKLTLYLASMFINSLYLRIKGFSVIHAHWIIPQGVIAILVKKIMPKTKVLVSVHGSDITTLNNKVFLKTKRFVLKNADIVTVNSSDTRRRCNRLYERDYQVIPMGIDQKIFSVKNSFDENHTILNLVFVGRLTKEKGIIELLEALSLVTSRRFKLRIAGAGPLEYSAKKYCQVNGLSDNVDFLGWLSKDELADLYRSSDFMVNTSDREAQGIAIVEALCCGLPVIAHNVGGIPDIISDGYNGLLVKKGNKRSLTSTFDKVIQDRKLTKKLKKNVRSSNISKNFDWKNIGEHFTYLITKG